MATKDTKADSAEAPKDKAFAAGDKALLVSVKGIVTDPFTMTVFEPGRPVKVESADSWHVLQVETGVLAHFE